MPPMEILIFIQSSPENFNARKSIRQTWADPDNLGKNVSVIFLLGVQHIRNRDTVDIVHMGLDREIRQYDDLLIADFEDAYVNLTLKSVTMLKAVETLNIASRYIMKVITI